ncbi:ATP-binding cassette domain-containing protein [Desulfosporosinus shakirovi]|uniref:ATP-binding cassette domain-containing protein n=1 Tax=Desulfosporosinus shakirovi TaxID=2885154 RepID=UPI001E36F8DE|nr:ATP-binding cassette domain-containing protein [Desulfosporosinus sp. SRJS8]MCB8815632.1 ATP-binding cassette domain-containing protein [Desulfosporosinus sp. SRJS8]
MILKVSKFKARYSSNFSWWSYPKLELRKGMCLAIMGKTGCGKTTLLNALFSHSFTGMVEYDLAELMGKDLRVWGRERYQAISYMPQYAQNGLNPTLTIGEQIELVKRSCKVPDSRLDLFFQDLGLEKEISRLYPFQISGGMKQRVIILMGFIKQPQLFILDEPSSALDFMTLSKTMDFLKKRKHEGAGLIVVSHHLGFATSIADKVIEL